MIFTILYFQEDTSLIRTPIMTIQTKLHPPAPMSPWQNPYAENALIM